MTQIKYVYNDEVTSYNSQMAYVPMTETNKSAGDRMLDLIRMKYPEYHPVVAMADLAHSTDNEEIEFKCHQSIAKFVLPELKSIEVRAQINEQRRVVVELFDESLMPKQIASDVFSADVLGSDRPKASEIIEAELSEDTVSAADMIKAGVRHVLESDE